jgi:hypothetical protein
MSPIRPALRCRPRALGLAALTLTAGLFACSNEETVPLGSVNVKAALIAASTGGELTVSAAESARLAGTIVRIPAGALERDTRITIGTSDRDALDDETDAAGPVVELGPDGTQFAADKPAEIIIPYAGDFDDDLVRVIVTSADGTREVKLPEDLTYDAATKTLRFTTAHFTRFQGGRGRSRCAHVRMCSTQCRRGRCQTPNTCMSDRECASGQSCVSGQCTTTPTGACRTDQDCAAGFECATGPMGGGRCTPINNQACMSDRECGAGLVCINATCQRDPGVTMCRTDQDCGMGLVCQADPSGAGRCVPPQNTRCMSDRECAAGQSCVNGLCSTPQPAECRTDRDCSMGLQCVFDAMQVGRCEVPQTTRCMSDRECAGGQSCVNGQCTTTPTGACRSDQDCAAGLQCYVDMTGAGRCGPINNTMCRTDADCGAPGLVCIANLCQRDPNTSMCRTDADCGMGLVCTVDATGAGRCGAPTPTRCMSSQDCRSGEACINSVCRPSPTGQCQSDRDCVSGFQCVFDPMQVGRCTPINNQACMTDRDCANGAACVNGVCGGQATTCGFATCGAGLTCCNASCGLCVPPGMACDQALCTPCGRSACAPGEQCTMGPNGPYCTP